MLSSIPLLCSAICVAALLGANSRTEEIVFPADAGVVDVTKPPYHAKGDGKQDDTAAIQKALDDHPSANAIIYLPNGTYLVSETLRWPAGSHGGVWMKRTILQGQSEKGTIIRLRHQLPEFQDPSQTKAVIYTGGPPAQRFRNSIRNLTVDTGTDNPGATGIQYIANNQGTVANVTIRSGDPARAGVNGLDLGFANEQGPCLIRNVSVEGFDIGIRNKHVVDSVTMEFISLRHQRKYGTVNDGQVVSIRRLTSYGTVPAVLNTGSASVLTLVDATLSSPQTLGRNAAILNQNDAMLFARNIETDGFAVAVQSDTNERITGHSVIEYSSHPALSLSTNSPGHSLRLTVKETPEVPWGNISKDWISPLPFGGKPDGKFDNTEALQRALNSGRKTVYLPNGNWKFDGIVAVGESVQRIIGCEAKLSGSGTMVIGPGASPLRFERIDMIYSRVNIDHRSSRTFVMSSVTQGGGDYISDERSGELFLEDVCGGPWRFKGQNVWARQLNPESQETKIINDGGTVWILGLKTERGGTLIENRPGARSEVLGCFAYANTADEKPPMFINDNGALSFTMGEMVIRRQPFRILVRQITGNQTNLLTMDDAPDRGGGSRVALYSSGPTDTEPKSPRR